MHQIPAQRQSLMLPKCWGARGMPVGVREGLEAAENRRERYEEQKKCWIAGLPSVPQ